MTQPNPRLSSLFELEYPQSLGVYPGYLQVQAAVDFLADAKFAVQNLAIVGTDLKSVERVTGRRNWATVLVRGLQSGVSTGLMVTFILWFLQPQMNPLVLLPGALAIGILIGIAFSGVGYAMSRGKRDFNSISQNVAASYELLCEHKVAAQARELLATMPGARAAAFDPRTAPAPWQPPNPGQPYPGQPYAGQPGQYPGQPGPAQSYPGQPAPTPYPAQAPYPGQPPYGVPAQHSYPAAPPSEIPPAESPAPEAGSANGPYGSYGSSEGIGQPPTASSDAAAPASDAEQAAAPDQEQRTQRDD